MLVKRVSSLGEFSVKSVCSGKAFSSGSSGMRRIFFSLNNFIYLFFAMLSLHCSSFSLAVTSGSYSLVGVGRLLISGASLAEHGL